MRDQFTDTTTGLGAAPIEREAQILLERHHIIEPPIPVERLAVAEGIQIARSNSPGQESGFLLRDHRTTLIGVNSKNSARRQRFTIAHTIGHWRLHPGRPLTVDHIVRLNERGQITSSAPDRDEREANAFALALLMPGHLTEATVQRRVAQGVDHLEQLTKLLTDDFDVSAQAVSCRLINLGIVTCP